ncbi:MAG: DMT family transporter, partial [Dongiaceae bacterium]
MNRREWLLLVSLSILWGGSFFFYETALRDFGPFTIVFGRVGLAAVLLYGWLRLSRLVMPRDLATWRRFAAMGILNNVIPFSLIIWGQQRIDSGLAAILNSCTPLFTIMLAHFLTPGERLTVGRLAGVLIGIIGVLVLLDPR